PDLLLRLGRGGVQKVASCRQACASPRNFDWQYAPIYGWIEGFLERDVEPRLSGGGPSPLRTVIPANRDFNREFCRFPCCRRAAGPRQLESIQQIGYALTDYLAASKQGIPFREQGMIAMEQGFHFR
ncbi:MAG: hypothetical protein JWQ49_4175, partial [Edaphobacter sp.]|nr:hypothetical protein [Edaphobacter sp.]